MSIFSQAFLTLVSCNLVALTLFPTGHTLLLSLTYHYDSHTIFFNSREGLKTGCFRCGIETS